MNEPAALADAASARLAAAIAANGADLLGYFERRVACEDAADLLGETLLISWRRVTDLPVDPAAARPWLYGVARNVLANHRRGVRRRLALADRLRAEVVRVRRVAGGETGPQESIRLALGGLPDDLAELVMLVHWDGFGIAAAGDLLGLNASTARSRYARARQLLALALSEDAADGRVELVATSGRIREHGRTTNPPSRLD